MLSAALSAPGGILLWIRVTVKTSVYSGFPSASNADSIDWKDPAPEDITKKVVGGVKSGSIVLFHNDLENTTKALPDILEQLKGQGYSFVPVSELIFTEDYTIDNAGRQIPAVQSAREITPENVEEVMAEYSDRLTAAGFTEEQLALAVQAVKNGAEVPDEVYDALAEYVMAPVSATAESVPAGTAESGAGLVPENGKQDK